jgi:hypothetical protein
VLVLVLVVVVVLVVRVVVVLVVAVVLVLVLVEPARLDDVLLEVVPLDDVPLDEPRLVAPDVAPLPELPVLPPLALLPRDEPAVLPALPGADVVDRVDPAPPLEPGEPGEPGDDVSPPVSDEEPPPHPAAHKARDHAANFNETATLFELMCALSPTRRRIRMNARRGALDLGAGVETTVRHGWLHWSDQLRSRAIAAACTQLSWQRDGEAFGFRSARST